MPNMRFNKSHAAAYAVVSYQTAYLKYYYPVEFMAALMTSVIDNPAKVSEYIYSCRQMGNSNACRRMSMTGEAGFSVDKGRDIRYGLSAISISAVPLSKHSLQERQENGPFQVHQGFYVESHERQKDLNKRRAMENFIKGRSI
ncbi:MAG: hypothetical protein ACLTDV_05310 [Eubacterium sp.]